MFAFFLINVHLFVANEASKGGAAANAAGELNDAMASWAANVTPRASNRELFPCPQDFPDAPGLAIEGALTSALAAAAAAEDIPLDDLSCARDYSAACPVGVCLAHARGVLIHDDM